MTGLVVATGAKLAESALLSKATSIATVVPKPVWEALTVLAYLFALIALHQHYAGVHDKALIAANDAKWQAKLDAQTAELKAKDAQLVQISVQLRKANDEANTRIAGDAGALKLLGPGKAACPRLPGPSAAPGRSQPTAPQSGVAGPSLPPADFAAVPWNWLTDRAEEHDQLLNENKAWRDWYSQIVKAWPKNTGAAATTR